MLQVSWEKLSSWLYASHHFKTLEIGSRNLLIKHEILNLVLDHECSFLLRIRMIENHRCVLSSLVITLHVESGWIVKGEKEPAELLITHFRGVKSEVENFNMAGFSTTSARFRPSR